MATGVLGMLLFGLPLGVVVGELYRGRALEDLALDAERAHSLLPAELLNDPAAIERAFPAGHESSVRFAVYGPDARLVVGTGPETDELVARTVVSAIEEQGRVGDDIVAVVPLVKDPATGRQWVVRAQEPTRHAQRAVYLTWLLVALLAVAVFGLVTAVGRARARRLAEPLTQLARAAEALGSGDFSVRAERSGVAEVDAASANLERTARRLGGMIERERAFSADASHQLRTPLTAARVQLESALITPGVDLHAAVEEALVELDRLEGTVTDLLTLARDTTDVRAAVDITDTLAQSAVAWRRRLEASGRPLDHRIDGHLPLVAVAPATLRTVLDVLLANALTHGAGRVRLLARAADHAVVVEVSDSGPGVTGSEEQIFGRRSAGSKGTGIGLALARSLIEADGGRLELTSRTPAVFTVVLPL